MPQSNPPSPPKPGPGPSVPFCVTLCQVIIDGDDVGTLACGGTDRRRHWAPIRTELQGLGLDAEGQVTTPTKSRPSPTCSPGPFTTTDRNPCRVTGIPARPPSREARYVGSVATRVLPSPVFISATAPSNKTMPPSCTGNEGSRRGGRVDSVWHDEVHKPCRAPDRCRRTTPLFRRNRRPCKKNPLDTHAHRRTRSTSPGSMLAGTPNRAC